MTRGLKIIIDKWVILLPSGGWDTGKKNGKPPHLQPSCLSFASKQYISPRTPECRILVPLTTSRKRFFGNCKIFFYLLYIEEQKLIIDKRDDKSGQTEGRATATERSNSIRINIYLEENNA